VPRSRFRQQVSASDFRPQLGSEENGTFVAIDMETGRRELIELQMGLRCTEAKSDG